MRLLSCFSVAGVYEYEILSHWASVSIHIGRLHFCFRHQGCVRLHSAGEMERACERNVRLGGQSYNTLLGGRLAAKPPNGR